MVDDAPRSNWTPHQQPRSRRRSPSRSAASSRRSARTDPGFSIVVFEDFLYFLYAEMHRARGAAGAEALAAYVADHARAALQNDGRVGGGHGHHHRRDDVRARRRRRAGRRAARRRRRVELRRALPAAGRAALLREGAPAPHARARRALARPGQGAHAQLPELRRPALQHARHDVQLLPARPSRRARRTGPSAASRRSSASRAARCSRRTSARRARTSRRSSTATRRRRSRRSRRRIRRAPRGSSVEHRVGLDLPGVPRRLGRRAIPRACGPS